MIEKSWDEFRQRHIVCNQGRKKTTLENMLLLEAEQSDQQTLMAGQQQLL